MCATFAPMGCGSTRSKRSSIFRPSTLLADIQLAIEEEASRQNRILHVIAESDLNDVRVIKRREEGRLGTGRRLGGRFPSQCFTRC